MSFICCTFQHIDNSGIDLMGLIMASMEKAEEVLIIEGLNKTSSK